MCGLFLQRNLLLCYEKGTLEGTHSSVVDARAQNTIFSDERFVDFIDRKISFELLSEVWKRKRKRNEGYMQKLERPYQVG